MATVVTAAHIGVNPFDEPKIPEAKEISNYCQCLKKLICLRQKIH